MQEITSTLGAENTKNNNTISSDVSRLISSMTIPVVSNISVSVNDITSYIKAEINNNFLLNSISHLNILFHILYNKSRYHLFDNGSF